LIRKEFAMQVLHWHASVDYLKISAPLYAIDEFPLWRRTLRRAVAEADGAYKETENAKSGGYYGTGFDGGAFVGVSDHQGLLMYAAGSTAHALALVLPFEPVGVPRIDIQVTCWLAEDDEAVAERTNALHMARRTPAEKQPLPRLIKGNGGGDTFYAGSRGGTGSNFVRVYDKYRRDSIAQRNEVYRNAWRWECELTNRRAKPAYFELRAHQFGASEIAAMVRKLAAQRYVDVPPTDGATPFDAGLLPRPGTDDESRLRWLRNQVRPALDKMIASGYSDLYLAKILFE
jgi:hypothetical protein